MGEPEHPYYEFGPFVLDTREKVLWREGQPVPLKPKGYRVLLALVERSGFIVEKDYFMREVWDGSLRGESNLPQQVSLLRKTLGEVEGGNEGEKYIETVATRGYKFIASVHRVQSPVAKEEAVDAGAAAQSEAAVEGFSTDPASAASLVVQKHTAIRVGRSKGEGVLIHRDPAETSAVRALDRPFARTALFGLGLRGKLLIGFVVCAVVAVALFQLWPERATRSPQMDHPAGTDALRIPGEIKSIAVLPFRSRGENAGNEYLGMGLAEAVAMKLGGINALIVRPMSAVEREMRERGDDHLATGRALRTDAVLEGSIQQVGDQVRVTAQLLRVSDGKQLWSGKFDEESAQVFRIQDAISEQLVGALALRIGEGERDRLARRHTQNPEAYRLYLLGRYFWRTDAEKSRRYHQQALEADPSYALAHAGLADTYAFGTRGETALAEKHAREALRLDETLAEPHATLGFLQMFFQWKWQDAGKEFQRALELNPHYATAHQWYAIYHACEGRMDEAVARMKQAVELDPLSPAINADMGQMYFFAGDLEQALAACRRALELDPQHGFTLLYLFYIHAKAGQDTEAADAYLRFTEKADPSGSRARRAGYKDAGLRGLLLQDIDYFVNVSRNPMSYNRVAEDYALLGNHEQALNWLEKSVESKNLFMAFIKVNPIFTNMRHEPRFKALVERVGLSS
jgi:DNA-binding winged helix-turn-helix (wHTH) protein/TolB-like protein